MQLNFLRACATFDTVIKGTSIASSASAALNILPVKQKHGGPRLVVFLSPDRHQTPGAFRHHAIQRTVADPRSPEPDSTKTLRPGGAHGPGSVGTGVYRKKHLWLGTPQKQPLDAWLNVLPVDHRIGVRVPNQPLGRPCVTVYGVCMCLLNFEAPKRVPHL